jgi:hypothetical protein
MPLMHGDAHGQGFLFADGAGGYAGDGVFSLDDLDVGVVGGAMMQAEWGDQFWLGDDSVGGGVSCLYHTRFLSVG